MNPIVSDEVHNAVFLSQSPGPHVRAESLERFGFADSREGIANDRLHQLQQAQRELAVVGDEERGS